MQFTEGDESFLTDDMEQETAGEEASGNQQDKGVSCSQYPVMYIELFDLQCTLSISVHCALTLCYKIQFYFHLFPLIFDKSSEKTTASKCKLNTI